MKRKDSKSNVVEMTVNIIRENIPNITIQGDNEISIENHQGVELFQDNKIVVKTVIGNIIVEGNEFEIIYLSSNAVIIKGKLRVVTVERSDYHE